MLPPRKSELHIDAADADSSQEELVLGMTFVRVIEEHFLGNKDRILDFFGYTHHMWGGRYCHSCRCLYTNSYLNHTSSCVHMCLLAELVGLLPIRMLEGALDGHGMFDL